MVRGVSGDWPREEKKMTKYVCVHESDPLRVLRADDYLSALREIRSSIDEWGWLLPTAFNLCVELSPSARLYLVCCVSVSADRDFMEV